MENFYIDFISCQNDKVLATLCMSIFNYKKLRQTRAEECLKLNFKFFTTIKVENYFCSRQSWTHVRWDSLLRIGIKKFLEIGAPTLPINSLVVYIWRRKFWSDKLRNTMFKFIHRWYMYVCIFRQLYRISVFFK